MRDMKYWRGNVESIREKYGVAERRQSSMCQTGESKEKCERHKPHDVLIVRKGKVHKRVAKHSSSNLTTSL